MKLKIWLMAVLLIAALSVQAQEQDPPTFKDKIRPWVEKLVGATWSEKLLGPKPEEVLLPSLPVLTGDTKSMAVYDKKAEDKKLSITKDQEANLDYFFVKELYEAVRGVQPQGDEMSKWQNVLGQGGSREGVYRALVLDDQYARLENYNKDSSEKVVQFVSWYLPRFVGQSFTSPEKINFYTMKREVVEKSLSMIDALAANRANLVSWYAVLSGELAEKYPGAYKQDLRKSSQKKRHKLWAEKTPEQHIKSEVIIKIHLLLNALEA